MHPFPEHATALQASEIDERTAPFLFVFYFFHGAF
jgi:hypothetical protein